MPNADYLRVKKELTSTYDDPTTGSKIDVPGIIIAATKNVMRTEGVIVDALLGQGEALDAYSSELQQQALKTKELGNAAAAAWRWQRRNVPI